MDSHVGPELSVLMPTHNGSRWLEEALGRLNRAAGALPHEIIIVDNASQDATASICENRPDTRLLANSTNVGFSRAVNQAAALSQGRVLAVINQDLYLEPGSLQALHKFLASRTAVVGGGLSFINGTPQSSAGPFPSAAQTLLRLTLPGNIQKNNPPCHQPHKTEIVDWVTGAFMAFNREVFDAIGGFDEGFFMYYEDVDFCLRARQAGFPTYFLPEAKAIHVNPHASRKKEDVPVWLQKEIRRSQMRYFKKHRPRWESAAINALNRAYYAAHGWPWP